MTLNSDQSSLDEDHKPTRRFEPSSEDSQVEDFIETKRREATESLESDHKPPLGLEASDSGAEATTVDGAKYGTDTVSVDPGSPFFSGETVSQAPPSSQQVIAPDFLDHKYIIGVELDRGGMGRVFSATCKSSGEKVVIKVLSFMGKSDRRLVRFHREAGALSLFQHNHILQLREFGVHWEDAEHGVPYLVTDCVPGSNLQDIVRESLRKTRTGPDVDWLIKQFQGVAEALKECHKTGIIHRDIKPANIVMDEGKDRAVLIDFGLSKADPEVFEGSITAFKESLTATGQVLGTPLYMAPEQLFGVRDRVGPGSDVWGFAATFFYCLTGRLPFDVESPLDLVDAMETEDPPPVRQFNPNAPQWLETLLEDCFKKNVSERPSMSQILNRMKTLHANQTANTHRRGKLLWLALVPVAAMIFITIWSGSTNATSKLPTLRVSTPIKKTLQSSCMLTIEVECNEPVVVHLVPDGKEATSKQFPLKGNSSFEVPMKLHSGLNSWTVYIVDRNNKKLDTKVVNVRRE